jgi:hypothetical protein
MKLSNFQQWYYTSIPAILADDKNVDGWNRFNSKYRKMDAFYNKTYGMVVKRPNFIMDKRTPLKLRVPTVNLGNGWVLQPLVKKTNLKQAVDQIKMQLKNNYPNINPDLHVGNVGWYEGKPLMFDW